MVETSSKILPLDELMAEIESQSAGRAAAQKSALRKTKPVVEKKFVDQYIRFYLENILLAIPLNRALEISHRPEVTPLPNIPEWVLGVSNIRGEIISIVDLKAFLGMPSHGITRDCRLMIVHNRSMKVGLIVDRVTGQFSMSRIRSDLQNNPYQKEEIAAYILGVIRHENQMVNILDIDKLLNSSRMNAFGE